MEVEKRVEQLEESTCKLKERVYEVETVQTSLVEAVKDLKDAVESSINRYIDQSVWTSRFLIGSLWGAVVITIVKDYL